MKNMLVRGAVVLVELIADGHIQGGTRPAIVVSNDRGNKFSPTLIVSPLTSRDKKPLPTHCELQPNSDNGLSVKSTVLTEQMLTVNKTSVKRVLGKLTELEVKAVNKAIQISLELF